ncbi:hypothetical protein APASM_4090 [Actinosynnema pretiosum subsp. pretiosum]|nr:hypothetical protein APASM_4090 [Actinosynnema pretiosum subsp. pretiosum]
MPGGPKATALLAALVRQGGRVVATERLVDLLWDDGPPVSATALVHTHVSQLRRGLTSVGLGGALRTRAPGYQPRTEPGDHDVDVFAAEHEWARRAEAAVDELRVLVAERPLREGSRALLMRAPAVPAEHLHDPGPAADRFAGAGGGPAARAGRPPGPLPVPRPGAALRRGIRPARTAARTC